MTDQTAAPTRKGVPIWLLVVIVVAAAAITGIIAALLASTAQRAAEAAAEFTLVQPMDTQNNYPETWKPNFPDQYAGWAATETFKPTLHLQSLVAREATDDDPRTATTPSKLEEDPRLLTLWAGNIFSKDYRHLRGHYYAYIDQNYTQRVLGHPTAKNEDGSRNMNGGQPAACLNCHASLPVLLDKMDWEELNALTYFQGMEFAESLPLGCIDCHNPLTMELNITRPALINAMADMKAEEGIQGYDVNKDATPNEMRALICAQCHVEYYFAPGTNNVVFPWKFGIDIDDGWDYYTEIFSMPGEDGKLPPGTWNWDFANAKTGARQLKAQHPEYEMWSGSIHAANGVTCADCHMPYVRNGSQKTSNHEIMSPMANIEGTCGQCHTASAAVLEDRVRTSQNRFTESRDRAFDAIVDLFEAIAEARGPEGDIKTPEIKAAQDWASRAGYYLDFITSENSAGFHAPDYFQRVANQALEYAHNGHLALLGVTVTPSATTQHNATEIEESGLR